MSKKNYLILILVLVMIFNSFVFIGCGKESTDKSDNLDASKVAATDAPDQLPYLVDSSFPSETFSDYISASPFYTPSNYETLFVGTDYLSARDQLIQNIAGVTEMAEMNINMFYWSLDSLQTETLAAYGTIGQDHPEVNETYDFLKEAYAKQIALLSKLIADIEMIKDSTSTDPYIKAWEAYERTQKNIELSVMVIEYVTKVIEDGLYLEEYLIQNNLIEVYAWQIESIETMRGNYEDEDWLWENLFLNIAELVNSLNALERAEAYATLSILEQAKSELTLAKYTLDNTDQASHLQEEEWAWVEASLVAQLQLLDDQIVAVKTFNDIELEHAHAFTKVSVSNDSAIEKSNLAMDQALEIVNMPMRPEEKKQSIFTKLIRDTRKKVTGFTGKLLEKASTATYKVAITLIGNDYGLSQADIDEEKQKAEALEKKRIAEGTAGSQVIRDGIKWIEDKEKWVGKVAKEKLGEDSLIAKAIDGASRYGIQKITGSGKNAMILLDQNATDEEILNAFVDVAKTTFNGLKMMDKVTSKMDKEKADYVKKMFEKSDELMNYTTEFLKDAQVRFRDPVVESFEEDIVHIDTPNKIIEDAMSLAERENGALESVDDILVRDFDSMASYSDDVIELVKVNIEETIETSIPSVAVTPPTTTEAPLTTEPITEHPTTSVDVTTAPPTTAPPTTAPPTTASGNNPNVNYEYLSKRVGTYSGEIVHLETMYGGSDQSDDVQIVIDNSNIIISSDGSTQTFGQEFSFTFKILMSNMAGVITGDGLIPGDMIVREDKEAVDGHKAMVALTFHDDGARVISVIQLFYGPSSEERVANIRIEAERTGYSGD